MDKHLITERIEKISKQVATANGLELVHIEVAGTKRDAVLRIFIDKEGGVTLDDCSMVSKGIEEILDAEDFIPSRYVLEVSSPGIERQLYSLGDFVKFTGHLAKVKLKAEIGGQRTFVGTINGVDGDKISFEDRTRGPMTFGYPDVDKANLKIDLSKEFGPKAA
jgi:ribosome maturation factor RimP